MSINFLDPVTNYGTVQSRVNANFAALKAYASSQAITRANAAKADAIAAANAYTDAQIEVVSGLDPVMVADMQLLLDQYESTLDATDTGVAAAIAAGPQTTALLKSTYAPVDAPLAPKRRFLPGMDPRGTRMILAPHNGHGWTIVNGGDGSATTEDTTRPGPFSDRSIKIARVAQNTEIRNANLPAIDLRNGPLVVWVYLPDTAPKGMTIDLGNNSANFWGWTIYGTPETGASSPHVDGWTAFELFPTGKVGSPTLDNLTYLRIRASTDDTTVWLGAIGQRLFPTTQQFAAPEVVLHPGVTTGWDEDPGAALDATKPSPFTGQSYRLDYESGSQGIIKTGLSLGTIEDVFASGFVVWAQFTPGMYQPQGLVIELGDDGFTNRHFIFLYGQFRGSAEYQIGDWYGFRLHSTLPTDLVGTAPANITGIRIKPLAGNGTDPVWVGGIEVRSKPPLLYPNGVLTLFFDDAYTSVYTKALPTLGKYGFPGVTAVIADYILSGSPNFATVAQLREMQDRAGWEIAGHSFSPNGPEYRFDQFTPEELEAEFRNLKQFLVTHGFDSDTWVSPGGVSSTAIWEVGRRYFSLHRAVGTTVAHGAQSASPRRAYPAAIFAPNFSTNGPDKQTMKDIASKVRELRSWGFMAFHQVTDAASSGQQISVADLDEICAHIESLNIPVRTVKQILTEAN